MSELDSFFRELRIERSGTKIFVLMSPEEWQEIIQEIIRYVMHFLWGDGGASVAFASTGTGQEEIRLREKLFLAHTHPEDFTESIPQVEAVLDSLTNSERHHLTIRWSELKRRYDELTRQITNLDNDIGREMEQFRKQPLIDRRTALEAERTEVVHKLAAIERRLADVDLAPGT